MRSNAGGSLTHCTSSSKKTTLELTPPISRPPRIGSPSSVTRIPTRKFPDQCFESPRVTFPESKSMSNRVKRSVLLGRIPSMVVTLSSAYVTFWQSGAYSSMHASPSEQRHSLRPAVGSRMKKGKKCSPELACRRVAFGCEKLGGWFRDWTTMSTPSASDVERLPAASDEPPLSEMKADIWNVPFALGLISKLTMPTAAPVSGSKPLTSSGLTDEA